jgi:hypothetical protein
VETDTFWINKGVERYLFTGKTINAGFYHNTYLEMDHSANGIMERGIYVGPASTSLMAMTGGATDSFVNQAQNIMYSTPKKLFPFPMTSNYVQHHDGRVAIDFQLLVPAFGLNYTPGQHVYHDIRNDSIIGWGTTRVWMPGGGVSAPVDVLIDKISTYTIDSFYLGGAPANATIQNAFGITQGQITNQKNMIQMYRKGYYNYFVRYWFGTDNTFTNLTEAYINTDGLQFATEISSSVKQQITSVLYPNPTTAGKDLNLMLSADQDKFTQYEIIGMNGSIISRNNCEWKGNTISIPTQALPIGQYSIKLSGSTESILEAFTIQ